MQGTQRRRIVHNTSPQNPSSEVLQRPCRCWLQLAGFLLTPYSLLHSRELCSFVCGPGVHFFVHTLIYRIRLYSKYSGRRTRATPYRVVSHRFHLIGMSCIMHGRASAIKKRHCGRPYATRWPLRPRLPGGALRGRHRGRPPGERRGAGRTATGSARAACHGPCPRTEAPRRVPPRAMLAGGCLWGSR